MGKQLVAKTFLDAPGCSQETASPQVAEEADGQTDAANVNGINHKTVHIDAFVGSRAGAQKEPISPYLGFTKDEEMKTQRKIYRYWRDRGVDVTSEWAFGMRPDRFVGLQAWA